MLLPAGLLAGFWLLLTDLAWDSWLIGLPVVAAAAWSAQRTAGAGETVSLPALLRFISFFLRESLRGGVDVACRVVRPTMRIRPGFHRYRVRLQGRAPRLLFLNSVSLLPGTLSTALDKDELRVHALDTGADLDAGLGHLEAMCARVYREVI